MYKKLIHYLGLDKSSLWGLLALSVAGLLFIVSFLGPTDLQELISARANVISAVVTIMYVWLTYKLLKYTLQSRSYPYIKVDFLITNALDQDFLNKYEPKIRKNARYVATLTELKNIPPPQKNIVFAKVKNIGDRSAVECILHLKYQKASLGDNKTLSAVINFGVIECDKENKEWMEMVEVYDNPTQADSFKLSEAIIEYKDIGGKLDSVAGEYKDFTKDATFEAAAGVEISYARE